MWVCSSSKSIMAYSEYRIAYRYIAFSYKEKWSVYSSTFLLIFHWRNNIIWDWKQSLFDLCVCLRENRTELSERMPLWCLSADCDRSNVLLLVVGQMRSVWVCLASKHIPMGTQLRIHFSLLKLHVYESLLNCKTSNLILIYRHCDFCITMIIFVNAFQTDCQFIHILQ